MTGKYAVRLIYPAVPAGEVDQQALLNSHVDSDGWSSMTVFGSKRITELFLTVEAGNVFRALTEASVRAVKLQELLGTPPDSADVLSPREYRRRLGETNLPILADALRELGDMDVIGT